MLARNFAGSSLLPKSRSISFRRLHHHRLAFSYLTGEYPIPDCGPIGLVGNYGYGWQTGTIKTRTAYKAFTDHEVAAQVGLHVGLRGINITLKGGHTSTHHY